jgi:hypothetical protein
MNLRSMNQFSMNFRSMDFRSMDFRSMDYHGALPKACYFYSVNDEALNASWLGSGSRELLAKDDPKKCHLDQWQSLAAIFSALCGLNNTLELGFRIANKTFFFSHRDATRVAKFFFVQRTKTYQIATKYTKCSQKITKWLQNIPNVHKIYQMAV